MGRRAGVLLAVVVFLAFPVGLFVYGASRCQELACIGPVGNAVLHGATAAVLLGLWWVRRRALYPTMLAFADVGMAYVSLRRDFDFSPLYTLVAIPAGLVAGALAFGAARRLRRGRGFEESR